jgi:glycosyltransferase involved in cell wall biosynthesis
MSGGQAPLVSVVCLCYNHASTVARALEGILAQETDFPFEVIVHDDASSDGTADVIRAFASAHPDTVVPVLQTENQYHRCNLAQTFIAPLLRGRYVAICEVDDYWTDPKKRSLQVEAMRADPEITMCFHAVTELSDAGERTFRPLKAEGEAPAGLIVKRGGMFCPSVSLLVRRDIADEWPGFRTAADVYDYPLQVLCALRGRVWYIDRVMGVYRFRYGDSWTAQRAAQTDYAHIENETAWLGMFGEYAEGRFDREIAFHLAHLWLTELRKGPTKEKRRKVRFYARRLGGKDSLLFVGLTAFFTVFGPLAERLFLRVKNRVQK